MTFDVSDNRLSQQVKIHNTQTTLIRVRLAIINRGGRRKVEEKGVQCEIGEYDNKDQCVVFLKEGEYTTRQRRVLKG